MRFEAHLLKDSVLPFIIHHNVIRHPTAFNIHENLKLLVSLCRKHSTPRDGGQPTGAPLWNTSAVPWAI